MYDLEMSTKWTINDPCIIAYQHKWMCVVKGQQKVLTKRKVFHVQGVRPRGNDGGITLQIEIIGLQCLTH